MTDPYATTPLVDDVDDTLDSESARLSRRADALLEQAEGRSFAEPASLRRAVREDAHNGRIWAQERAERARTVIQEEPLRATAYAVGIGVLIGLLLRR